MTLKRVAGNALTEYSIIGAVICSVCLLGLIQLGGNVNKRFDGFQASLVRKPLDNSSAQQNASMNASWEDAGMNSGHLLDEFKRLQAAIQVAGSNGTTSELVAEMELRIRQMREAGEITDAEADALIHLANRGHYLASAEKALEDAIARGQNSIQFDGKTYSLQSLRDQIGFDQPPNGEKWDVDYGYQNSIIASFVRTYQDAQRSSAMRDPEVKKVISGLSYQIVAIGDSLSWSMDPVLAQAGSPSQLPQRVRQLRQDTASNLGHNLSAISNNSLFYNAASSSTHRNSSDICSTGSGRDSGTQCKKRFELELEKDQ